MADGAKKVGGGVKKVGGGASAGGKPEKEKRAKRVATIRRPRRGTSSTRKVS